MSTNKPMFGPAVLEITYVIVINMTVFPWKLAFKQIEHYISSMVGQADSISNHGHDKSNHAGSTV